MIYQLQHGSMDYIRMARKRYEIELGQKNNTDIKIAFGRIIGKGGDVKL